jgi:hypothetical protein
MLAETNAVALSSVSEVERLPDLIRHAMATSERAQGARPYGTGEAGHEHAR